jgi:hypothetical protein
MKKATRSQHPVVNRKGVVTSVLKKVNGQWKNAKKAAE